LLAGLLVIAISRFLFQKISDANRPTFDKTALICLGLFLLLCVSRVTFFIFLAVAIGS
jgi:hypothetical protein